jgi:hypothetical protein
VFSEVKRQILAAAQKIYSARKRKALVAKWRSSGLTQAAFCRQEGLQEWELSNWKRRQEHQIAGKEKELPEEKRVRIARTRRESKDSERIWKGHVFAQVESGLKRSEYCNEHGLSINTFKRWRARFVGELKLRAQQKSEEQPNLFVEVTAPPGPALIVDEEILELILPGGIKVVVAERTSMRLLAKVLKAAQQEGIC